jgi:hypothetical protein
MCLSNRPCGTQLSDDQRPVSLVRKVPTMPLYASGLKTIRQNLLRIQAGQKPLVKKVGFFTPEQLTEINAARAVHNFPALRSEINFHGKHLYESRCLENGYTVDQILDQIQSAFSDASVIHFTPPSSLLRNPNKRADHDGILVNDEAVFECTGGFPYAYLYSVIPRGDGRLKPKRR